MFSKNRFSIFAAILSSDSHTHSENIPRWVGGLSSKLDVELRSCPQGARTVAGVCDAEYIF